MSPSHHLTPYQPFFVIALAILIAAYHVHFYW